jgi:hypothetical protein
MRGNPSSEPVERAVLNQLQRRRKDLLDDAASRFQELSADDCRVSATVGAFE